MDVKAKYQRRYTMKVTKAAKIWIDYHSANLKKILSDLNRISKRNKPYTKHVSYAHLSSLSKFVRNNIDSNSANP
jgi:hypothetical protein